MDEYLTYTKRRLSELETVDRVHVVLGNESCDLDSAVAALTYAFYLHHKSAKETGVLYLPVLNITSDQYRLRTETVYLLGRLNIKQTDLTFRDDIDLQTLKAAGKLDLTLVDHNVMVVHDQSLEDRVTTVIDHRPRDRQEQAGVRVVIDLVGSCCTLIAEELLSDPDFNLNHQVALLLYGTILIDTVNRSVAAGKLTQRDEAVLQRLEGVLQDVNGDQLYEDIQIAKCDLSGLTTMEILEKDLKMVPGNSMTVAMSSVSVDMQELLSRDCFTSDLETFCQQKGCPVVVVMSITAADEDNIYRQLAVFSTNRIFREQICDVLDLSTNPNLQLEPIVMSLDNISIFRQGNVKASRKKVLPVIKAFLNGDKTPDITSKEFASETQQAAAKVTEGFSSFSTLLDTNTTSMQNQSEESFFTGSNETHKQLFSKDDFDSFGALNSDDIPVKEQQSTTLVADSFDPFATSSMQNQSEEESYFTVSNETQFSDADFDPFGAITNDDSPVKEEHDKTLVDIQSFDPFKTISNSESSEWQSGSEIGSSDPWNSSGKSESVLKQTGSDLQFFDTFIDPVQGQSVAAEHPAASDSTPVQSKVQVDDFELMTPKSLKEETVSQSGISAHVDLGNLNQDSSASDWNLSANTNQPLLDYGPFSVGESSGEDLKNSWGNPLLAFQEVSFSDSAQLSPLKSVNVSDQFMDKSLDNLKFDQYRGGSHATQDGREKYGSVFDSLEMNEADLFDQINTPDYQSGVSTPLINSGISTPFESLHANHSGRNSESEPGYPTQTPPHSFTESGMANLNKDHVLPSFNSSEMVERIHRKKASLHGVTEMNFNTNSVPYTPQNSFIEGTFDAVMIDRDLPSFDNSEFVQKIHEKRSSLAGIHEGDMDSEVSQYPYAPHNSFISGNFDKYAQENLSSLNEAEAVENVRVKQAALAFFSGSDITNLSTQNESRHTESPSFGNVESNNPFLVNIESDASSSTNPLLFLDDDLLAMEEFMSPSTPQNIFSESNLHFLENRDSSIESELTETHSRKLPLIMDNENFQNVAAQNPTFENFEENLDSMQNETEEIEKDVCETDSLDNKFKEQEGQGEHEQKEKSFKEEECNDSHLFNDDLFYSETGKEEVLYSGFKSAASASTLDEDDVRLSEISTIWGQDIQQQDVVTNDNLNSGNIQSMTGKSKPDGLDGEYQIIESSIAQTEASSDNDEELENECDTRSEEDLLGSRDIEEIQEIAYSIAGEIIQTVLDNFPDLHIPIVAKTLQEVESNSLEEGSEVPISQVPNKNEGESIFSLETEYLPNMDPLGGNMDLVTSPSFSAQDQDNEFGDVETVSFHRASYEEWHGGSLHQGDTAHSLTLLPEGLSSVPEVTIEAAQVLENETLVFVPHKLGLDLISNQQAVSSDMISLSHAIAVNLETNEKVNEDQLVMNIEQAEALETEKQNSDSHEPDMDLVSPEAYSSSYLIDGPSFVPETNIEIVQLLESETRNLVTQELDMESVSHQPDSEWISLKPSSDLLLCQPVSEDILSLSDDAGDGFANNGIISVDQSIGTGLKNVPRDDYKAGEQNSFPDGSVLESFRNDLIASENEVLVEIEKSSSEMESVMNEKILDLAGNIVNSVLASAIECTMGESMKSNVKRHVVSVESIDFSPGSTSLEDDVIEFASESEIDHVETVLETEISRIGTTGDRKIFHIESAFETDIPDIEIPCEKEMSQSIQATKEDTVQTSEADGEVRHDSSDSEDSDTSSTTTEGSYRIEDPGVTYPPEMLYDTMDTMENSDLGQETPANYLLAEEAIEKVDIPDLALSVGYTYTSKLDESKQLCHVSELQDISGVPDTEDKYAVTEIIENSDLLEKQDYSSLIDFKDIPSIPHTEISSADSQTGTDIREIWELQDQNGHIVETFVRQTAEKDEKVQTWEEYDESVADTQNNNNSALVVDAKPDENESLSAYQTTETSKEEETVPDLMRLVVHKKEKLKGGYSLDLPIPFVIIQEAADDLPSEEESPSPPSASAAGKKSSNTADNDSQKNNRTATETVKDECENLGDIALTDSVSHESELTGRKQVEDDAFLSKADSTTGHRSQHADNTHIKAMLEEVLENTIEEEHRLQEGNVGKESACLKMSASEIDAGSFDENRLGKDTEIQEKSFAVEVELTSFEQNKMDEDYIVAEESGAFKIQSKYIMADSTGKDSEKPYTVETDTKSTEKNKTDKDNVFPDLNPVEEPDASKMELSYKAAETTNKDSEKSYAPETVSPVGNNVDEDNTIADFQLAKESDSFRRQSAEMKVDSTCKDFEKSFAAEIGTKSPEETKINMNNTVAEFKLVEEPSASKSQSDTTTADSTSKDSEKSFTVEADTVSPEENKRYEDNMFAEESNVSKILTSDNTTDSTSTDSEKSSAPTVETLSPEQNQTDVDSTFEDFKPLEEPEVSESHLIVITSDSTGEDSERSYSVKVETKPPQGNEMDQDNVIADLIPVEESDAPESHSTEIAVDSISKGFVKSYAAEEETKSLEENEMDDFKPAEESGPINSLSTEIADYSTSTDFENSFPDFKPVEALDAFKHQSAEIEVDSIGTDDFDQSYAPEVQTKSTEGKQMNEDKKVADFKPVEEFDASKILSFDNNSVTDITSEIVEKSYAAEVETISAVGENMDEDNTVADFKCAEDFDAFKSQSAEIDAHSRDTDFENSFAFADLKHGDELDASQVQSSYNAVESTSEDFEKSYAAEETLPAEENNMDEDNTVADFKAAEDFDAFKSQSAEIATYSTGTDFENSFAFTEFKLGEVFDVSKMQPSYNAPKSASEHFEKSYAAEAETMFAEESTMDEENTVADFKSAEDFDAFKSQSAEIATYSRDTDFENSFAFADLKLGDELDASQVQSSYNAVESTSEDFEKSYAAEETLPAEENNMDEDNTVADSKSAEDFDAFKSQSAEIATYSSGTDFKSSSAFTDFKPAEVFDVSKMKPSYNAAESASEDFEKSYAAEVETMSSNENTIDEGSTVADLKPAEEFDAFKSQSTEIAAHSRDTDFENSFAFTDLKLGDELDASQMQSSYNVVESTSEDFEKSYVAEAEAMFAEESTMEEDNTVADFKPKEDLDALKSQSAEITIDSTGKDSEKSSVAEVVTQSAQENKMDEDNTVADFKCAEDFDAFKSQSAEIATYSTGTDFENSFAFTEFKLGEVFDVSKMQPSYNAPKSASEHFEKSYAAEAETMFAEESTMDEDNTVADFKSAEDFDAFKSQSAEIATYSRDTDFENSFAFADLKLGDELDASQVQSSYNAVESTSEDFEKSYAAEETLPAEENNMDEDNTVADFKSAEDFDAFKSQSAEIATYSSGTDFKSSSAFTDFKPAEVFDVSKMKPSYNAAESASEDFEKSYAAEVETMSSNENTIDEGSTVADLKPAEEFDAFKSQSTEIAAHSRDTDFENSFAFTDLKLGDELDASQMQSSYNVVESTSEDFEKSYVAEAEAMFAEESTMEEDNTVADFKPKEDLDALKSQSAEITIDSTGKDSEKSSVAEVVTQSAQENKMDEDNTVADFKCAEDFDAFKSQSAEIATYSTGTDFENSFAFTEFKLGEVFDVSKMQPSYNAPKSASEHFEKSYAAEAETMFAEESTMDEDNTVADFKSAEDFDAFKSQSAEIATHSRDTDFENSFAFADLKLGDELDASQVQSSYNAVESTSEDFEKSYAAEETLPAEENNMDEDNTVADFKSAEDFDAFKSQSAEIATYSSGTDFKSSSAFTDFKPAEVFDVSKMKPSYNAAESASEDFEKSYAAEVETMSSNENTIDEGSTVADLKPAEEFDVLKSQAIEITVDSTGKDSKKSSVADVVTQSTQENKMGEDNLISDFIFVEESNAPESHSDEITVDTTGKCYAKSFVADIETKPLEKHKIDGDNTFADFQLAKESEALKSQSNEIADYSTVKDFEKSYAPEVQTKSSEGRQADEDKIVADFKPVEELDASKRLSSDNVTESASETFEKSYVAEVETLFAEENKMEEDNPVTDFKPAEELEAFKRKLTEITVDNMGTDFENSSVAEVESKSQEEKKVNNGTSTDFEKLSAAETENKSSLEEKMIEDITVIDLKPAQDYDASKSQSTEDKAENTGGDPESLERVSVSDTDNRSSILLRKEVFMTTAGRMSIAIDSTYENMIPEQKEDSEKMTSNIQCPGVSTVLEELQVEQILQEADSLVADVDKILASSHQSCDSSSTQLHELMAASLQPTEPKDKSLKEVENEKKHKRETSVTSLGSKEKMRGMDWTEEFYEDPIPGMEAEEVCDSSDDSQVGSSDSEEDDSKSGRPGSLFDERKGKKRIAADVNILNKDESADDLLDDPPTPDDLGDGSGELEWEKWRKLQESQAKTDDTPVTSPSEPLSSQYCARDDDEEDKEDHDKNQFRKVEIAGKEHRVDMGVIEPYKKVLSHGGYYGDGLNAIILFSGCYLPDRSRRDYQYVMDNLFLYVISTLELLVAEDYMIVYFHGATPRRQMPSFGWLKKCYQTIDRRLKKNLKTLLLVHPTLWLKTVVMMTKPFISSKFSSKLRFVKTLRELATIIPMEYIYVPEPVQLYDDRLRNCTSISTPSSSSSDTTTPR